MKEINQALAKFNDSQLTQIVELGLNFYPLKNNLYCHNVVKEALLDLANVNSSSLDKAYSYNANNAELFVLRILYGYSYFVIQEPFFNTKKSNQFTIEIHKLLDSLLQKAPRFHGKVLYRHEKHCSVDRVIELFKKGLPLKTSHYLTTDYEDYEREDGFSFIIYSLPNGKTNAHELYRIMSHNENSPYPEHQINFERDSLFKILAIENSNNRIIVKLEELELSKS